MSWYYVNLSFNMPETERVFEIILSRLIIKLSNREIINFTEHVKNPLSSDRVLKLVTLHDLNALSLTDPE